MLTRGRVDLWIYFPHIGYNVSRNMILGSSTFVRYGYFIDVSFGYVVICLLEVPFPKLPRIG